MKGEHIGGGPSVCPGGFQSPCGEEVMKDEERAVLHTVWRERSVSIPLRGRGNERVCLETLARRWLV
jgi:hypothetical protein